MNLYNLEHILKDWIKHTDSKKTASNFKKINDILLNKESFLLSFSKRVCLRYSAQYQIVATEINFRLLAAENQIKTKHLVTGVYVIANMYSYW